MKSLSKYILESLINEGGNAVKCERIPAEVALKLYKDIEAVVTSKFHGVELRVLGSVGKKKAGDTNGDIDIAINVTDVDKLMNIINVCFPNCEVNPSFGIGIVSIGYQYTYKGRNMVGQVDFMCQEDLDWAEFFYSSPDYTKDESLYKASLRNALMSLVVSEIPTREEPTMIDGQYETRYKHNLSMLGLSKQFLDYRGKKGLLKNPKKIKEMERFITKNKYELVEFMFNSRDLSIVNSLESLWNAVHGSLFRYPEVVKNIEERFFKEVLEANGLDKDEFIKITRNRK